MTVYLKRIKNKEDLKEVLIMIHEDVGVFGFCRNTIDITAALDRVIDLVERD